MKNKKHKDKSPINSDSQIREEGCTVLNSVIRHAVEKAGVLSLPNNMAVPIIVKLTELPGYFLLGEFNTIPYAIYKVGKSYKVYNSHLKLCAAFRLCSNNTDGTTTLKVWASSANNLIDPFALDDSRTRDQFIQTFSSKFYGADTPLTPVGIKRGRSA